MPLPPFLSSFSSSAAAASTLFVEPKLRPLPFSPLPASPSLAYLISGFSGDGGALLRALLTLYHPRNRYVVHLDLDSPAAERDALRDSLTRHPVLAGRRNVKMIFKANLVTYRGPTMVANTLHAAAMLLRDTPDWDWFINLSVILG
ncbi:beta-glucuronosyltransferase GlcAT14A-like [Ananas comosus]|uniref:Beta-glucuronosyltransferase GlcAT14A n=1 Tax=Ananas comosus TaxID=4615 RepID=A0A199VM66_ANACO|nr:beta-glucuronosyltransferase GlcAT14A-like [Ananas comosus]OAY77820.1 Beta-glucuronosyltransferase GlcAT14A [Ananas comosus]